MQVGENGANAGMGVFDRRGKERNDSIGRDIFFSFSGACCSDRGYINVRFWRWFCFATLMGRLKEAA